MDYLKKFLRTALLLVGAMLVLFFFLILVLQTRYGYLHASEKCNGLELTYTQYLTCISKTNLPQMNAYAKCRLVGVHRDYSNEGKYIRFCVYRCDNNSMEYLVEPDNRGCEVDKILFKTAI